VIGKYIADGMYSNDNEYIEFVEPIYLEGQVEHWLRNTGEFMKIIFYGMNNKMMLLPKKTRNNRKRSRVDIIAKSSTTNARFLTISRV
jgi:hypothetical protein